MKVLGIMTGTSMDGLDYCYADIEISRNFQLNFKILKFECYPYSEQLKSSIESILLKQNKKTIEKLHNKLGLLYLQYSKKILNLNHIDLISFHGQTISHINGESTLQIGNPQYLFDNYKIPIIYNFRQRDITLGGNGAPLMPFLDWLLFKDSKIDIITLNLGGISNLTYIPINGDRDSVLGFDCGPGMCLIDQYTQLIWKKDLDINAKYSQKGKINKNLLKYLLQDSFIYKKPPKSTGRQNYNKYYILDIIKKFNKIDSNDFIRTLVNFTANCIKINIDKFIPYDAQFKIYISGGGIHHSILLNDIKKSLNRNKIEIFYNNSLNSDFKEAFLIGVMGYAKYYNIPNNMISVTGATKLDSYGDMYE